MHKLALAVALALTTASVAAGAASAHEPSAAAAKSKPGARAVYIVSFAEAPLASAGGGGKLTAVGGRRKLDVTSKASRDYVGHLRARQDEFLADAAARIARPLAPRQRYAVVANGLAIELTPAEAQALRGLPGVTAVAPDRPVHKASDASAAWLHADQVWTGQLPGIAATRGEGVVVGVVDTGINEAHPSFAKVGGDGYSHQNPRGRVYGYCAQTPDRCTDKLIGIYDFSSDSTRTRGVDGDGHGSHVASTAAGNVVTAAVPAPTTTFTVPIAGVAPHANLIAYKVLDDSGSGSLSAIIAGIEQAVADQVDVINESIVGDNSDPWGALRAGSVDEATALLNARFAGTVVIASAGNDGPVDGSIKDPANFPWVVAAAAASHNRTIVDRIENITGTGIATPLGFDGAGFTGGLASARIVHAKRFGFALCGTGASQSNPNGGSNPFPPGTFHGEIVICDRGTYGRVEKGYNLKLAGAGGMILANTASDGESIVADAHQLPAVHVGFAAAQQLRALTDAAVAASGEIRGSITGAQRRIDDSLGDVLAEFSSRGPASIYGTWLKPNITAPGRDVLAADHLPNGFEFLSGTSMASPNVAGAAALIVAAHPTWAVAQVESALLTTGIADVRDFDLSSATPLEAGIGRANLAQAPRAALFFNTTREQFVAADPQAGGRPQALNMPYLTEPRCFETCSFARTVTDMAGGGSWRAEFRGPAAAKVTITPSSFMLGANASQPLQIDVDVTDSSLVAQWLNGEIALVNTSGGGVPETRVPVAIFASPGELPARIELATSSNAAATSRTFSGLLALQHLEIGASRLARSVPNPPLLPEITSDDVFAGGPGVSIQFFTLPGTSDPAVRAARVYADLKSATAQDVDLYVGEDADGDGVASSDETLCTSNGYTATEHCSFDVAASTADRTYWALVANFTAGPTHADLVDLVAAAVNLGEKSPQFVATGPGHTARLAPFDVRFAVDAPTMLAGERWLTFLDVGTSAQNPSGVGSIPVIASTDLSAGYGAQVLSAAPVASGPNDSIDLALQPNTAHERIAIDIPPNATSLTVSSAGSGEVDLYLARGAADANSPLIASAPPRTSAQGTSIHPGATESITLTSTGNPALGAGRWYITPVNTGTSVASATITATVTYGAPAPTARLNAYFNSARPGHGIFLSEGGSQRVLVWYTYLEDGSPTWYLAQGAKPAAGAGVWQAPLYRFAWDGSANTGTVVGEVLLTTSATNQLTYSWLVDGRYGSEPMIEVAPPACPQVGGGAIDYSGTWYAPALSGYGFSVLTLASTEVEVAYLYDGQGNPRWLYGQNSPFGSGSFALTQYTGFCPLCAYAAIQGRSAGTLTRTLANARSGSAAVSATFLAPVAGAWSTSQPTAKLTDDLGCN